MNTTPTQPDHDDRDELARLLPRPTERDLQSGRHQRLQEFVMSQIHQDLQPAERAPRRTRKRRPVFLAAALAAVAGATATTVVISTGDSGKPAGGPGGHTAGRTTASLSARQVLLAAATTAERTSVGSGTYWYIKTVTKDAKGAPPFQWESWTRRDGQEWFRGKKSGGKVVRTVQPVPFRLGGADVSFAQLEKLPATPDALKARIADIVKHGDVRSSAGRLNADDQRQAVFEGLVSLVSALPTTPKVRAAAFRAIATYPNVKNLGAVSGGQALEIASEHPAPPPQAPAGGGQARRDRDRLVVDPATGRVHETNFFVTPDGAEVFVPGGATIVAEWTKVLPR
ncbi:CU044_5270 family protein [Actinoallomurus purpureus]|uniref:CU044_5270 family protein n=1 Tax=Actinoallomurus purpureus TaxID=478114 RepID=UPI002092DA26|nr:CU044_5270 family protein [Actinoallomurus purpureus]MCO6007410.1 CU044_5270 family protein [Actinoallomurus purpureus]